METSKKPTAETGSDASDEFVPTVNIRGSAEGTSPGSSSTTIATPKDALLVDEIQRTRIFAASALGTCLLTAVALILMEGDALAKKLHWIGLIIGVAGGAWVLWRIQDRQRYSDQINLVFACTTSVAIFSCYWFWGVFSSAILVTPIVMYFFAAGASFRPAFAVFLLACVSHLVLGLLVVGGVVADHAVIRPVNLRLHEELAMLGIAQFVFVTAFVLARGFRNSISMAVDQLEVAVKRVSRGRALLAEAEQELALALKVGGPGRFSEQTLGSFRLGNLLGRGAMGEVYEAINEKDGQPAAVKMLSLAATSDPRLVRRFFRELTVAASLKSPNVVRVLQVAEPTDPIPFLAMERLTGESLADLLRGRSRMSAADGVKMLREVAAGVAAAHEAEIIHRDLKPRNLFLHRPSQGPETWKILDFGISKVANQSGTLTQGFVVGTPAYMAPEQARGEDVDKRSDVYSLGVIAYRALTGIPPFSGRDVPSILFAVAHSMPPCPSEAAGLNDALDSVLAVALAKDPSMRFQSPLELAEALERAADGKVEAAIAARAARILWTQPWGSKQPRGSSAAV